MQKEILQEEILQKENFARGYFARGKYDLVGWKTLFYQKGALCTTEPSINLPTFDGNFSETSICHRLVFREQQKISLAF